MSPFTAQVAEVEVEPDTGQVTLLDMVTAHDVGTIINPLGHQGQIEGGLMQGIGYGLLEEMRVDEGRIGTLSLGEYKLPNIKDIPPLRTVLVQEEVGPAPFQGKASGESSITPIGVESDHRSVWLDIALVHVGSTERVLEDAIRLGKPLSHIAQLPGGV